jgi:hypothetical protein
MSAAGRKRIAEAQRERGAKQKAASTEGSEQTVDVQSQRQWQKGYPVYSFA